MFKKKLSFKQTQLRSSATRKLKEQVKKRFTALAEEEVNELFDAEAIQQAKLPNKTLFYFREQMPLFFIPHKGELMPSLAVAHRFPHVVPPMVVYSPVSKFILQGADLMLPGVYVPPEGLAAIKRKETRALFVVGNPLPFAVGTTCVDSYTMKQNQMKGKAMTVEHIWGDYLCQWAQLPWPEGFSATLVEAVAEETPEPTEEKECGEVQGGEPEEEEAQEEEPNEKENEEEEEEEEEEEKVDMEGVLKVCLIHALRSLKDSSLPMSATTLYQSHMVESSNELGTPRPDVKQSSFKKLAKFLKEHTKSGLLKTKTNKKEGLFVTAVKQKHGDLTSFDEEAARAQYGGKRRKPIAAVGEEGARPLNRRRSVRLMYRAGPRLLKHLPPFQMIPKTALMSMSDGQRLLWEYVDDENLLTPDRKAVVLDPALFRAVFFCRAPCPFAVGRPVSRKEVATAFSKQMIPFYSVVLDGDERNIQFHRGDAPQIHIKVEKRMGRKLVTRVLGVEAFGLEPSDVARVSQKRFACSASTCVTPGVKKAGEEVVVQGKKAKEVKVMLENEFGVPSNMIRLTTNGL